MNQHTRITSVLLAAAMTAGLFVQPGTLSGTAEAADASYPVQEFRMGISDTDRNINLHSGETGDYLSTQTQNGTAAEKWYLHYVSAGVYEIVSAQTGCIITNENGLAVMSPDTDGANQRWKIVPVEQDFEGYDLYYKIVSNADNGAALTFRDGSNSIGVESYTGADAQKFRLDLNGLEGFAAVSKVDGKLKAGTIGGLLGETVIVKTAADLVSALDSTEPKTVVIGADIDLGSQDKTKQRIRDDKTIVGSFDSNTIYDSQLRNDDFYGADDRPSQNIVIRNVNWVARTLNNNGSGVILLQFYGVRNLWLDHNSFSATFGQNKDNEVGKFVWINTPAANWSDGKYNGYNPDYITASYNYFKNRYWTFAFGSQNKDTSRLHTTLMYNKWEQCSRRCPQYSNGYDHNYNNYHTVTDGSNPNKSSQVIGGEGSRVVNESCRFEGYAGNELDPDRNSAISFTESGSYTSDSPSGTPSAVSFKNLGSAWTVTDCYSYSLIAAYNTKGTDVKAFCNAYSGSFSSSQQIKYITDSDMSSFVEKACKSGFLRSVNVGNDPVGFLKTGAEMDTAHSFVIRNKGSQLYLSDGIQTAEETLFRFQADQDGYYRIFDAELKSCLWVTDNSRDNAAIVRLHTYTGDAGELFKFVEQADGTYTIVSKLTRDASCLGVAAGSLETGAQVVQWSCDETPSQSWEVSIRIQPLTGVLMDAAVLDTAYDSSWSLEQALQTGCLVYGDRDVTYGEIPAALQGAEYLRPACDSKNTQGDLVQITAKADLVLYAALDTRVEQLPQWLEGWTKTEQVLDNSKQVVYALYCRTVQTGETVTLGSNGQVQGCVQYTVFAVQKGDSGDVNGDGQCTVADAVMLQKFLIRAGGLANQTAADLSGDGVINGMDLVLLKRQLLVK